MDNIAACYGSTNQKILTFLRPHGPIPCRTSVRTTVGHRPQPPSGTCLVWYSALGWHKLQAEAGNGVKEGSRLLTSGGCAVKRREYLIKSQFTYLLALTSCVTVRSSLKTLEPVFLLCIRETILILSQGCHEADGR